MKVIFQDFDFIGGAWIRQPIDQLYLILGTEVVTGSESTTYEIHDFRIHGANYFSWYDESILLIFFFLGHEIHSDSISTILCGTTNPQVHIFFL